MAITSYTELQTAIANYSGRADLTSRSPEFISLTEAEFDRTMRTSWQEVRNTTFALATEYVAVPTDFMELRSMYLNTSPRKAVAYLPDDLDTAYYDTTNTNQPYVSITGGSAAESLTSTGARYFRMSNFGATTTATLTYYCYLPKLNGTTQTNNWLLTRFPDVYLWGTLFWGFTYLKDLDGAMAVKPLFEAAKAAVNDTSDRGRTANSMAVRMA